MDSEINSDALRSTLEELVHLLINSSRLTILNPSKVGSGAFGEVYVAMLDGSSKVATKQLRITQTEEINVRVAKRLARELKIWAKAKHPNVLELIGYHLSEQYDCAQLISLYMKNGNIVEYMERTQAGIEARLGFVRGITLGISYLHSCDPPICHGDLKPLNVLVNDKPDAVLCDFGLAVFIEDSEASSGLTTTRSIKGSLRYMSPELLDDKETKHTLESDIWAWACTIFEIITKVRPYADRQSDRSIWVALARGLSPGSMELLGSFASEVDVPYRSTLATLQALLPECWSMEPEERPPSSSILNRLDYVDPVDDKQTDGSSMDVDLESSAFPPAQASLDDKQTDDSEMTERVIANRSVLSRLQIMRESDHVDFRSQNAAGGLVEAAPDQGHTAAELNKQYLTIEGSPFARGPLSHVYQGRWAPPDDPQGIAVVVKAVDFERLARGGFSIQERVEEIGMYFPRDVSIWKRVNHPRITPFIGYTKGFNDRISFCSVTLRRPANLRAYTTIINPQADRFTLLCQALEGLVYLHTFSPRPIVHGALKPENILVTDEGNAELCTFGYAKFRDEVYHGEMKDPQPRDYYHYITPDDDLTRGTDIYGIGLTILYALSGKDAWHHLAKPMALKMAVWNGQLPKRADHPMEGSEAAVEKTWGLLKSCCHMSPNQRPSAQKVLDELLAIKALGGVRPPTSN